jgi:hypothetical protein
MKAKTTAINDELRFENFTEILSKEKMKNMLDEFLGGKLSTKLTISVLNEYDEFQQDFLSEFSNPEIKKSQKNFNKSFKELYLFQLNHFNESFMETGYKLESGLKNQLNLLLKDFEEKYKKFILIATKELSKERKTEKNKSIKPQTKEPKFPYKIPTGTRWENVTIKFLNDENILIKVKQFEHSTNFKEMNFIGRGNNPPPSEAWIFLKALSESKIPGEICIRDPNAKNKYKKQKEFLTKKLQNYFSIDYDPFNPYHSSTEKRGNSYKIKILLIPEPITNDEENDGETNDIKEYLKEQTQQ